MSNYNVGQIIKLTREAIGLSQEELSDGVCSVQTLSRIENGKVKVKKKTYQQLMEKMGRDGTKNYSVLSTENFELLDIMVEVNNLIFRHEYGAAEKKLEPMKNALSMEEKINYVFVRECEIIIDKNLHRISVEEALEEFEKLIALSIPDYKAFIHGVYPFFHEEIMLLMNIGHAYGDLGNRKMAIDIYYMLIRCMNMGYMRREDTVQITVMLISSAARLWGGLGQRDRAIRMSWNAIYKAKRNSLYTVLPKCYGEIAWNMMKQIKDGGRPEKDKKLCKQYLRQAYAVAVLSNQNWLADINRRIYNDFFGEDIYFFCQFPIGESSPSSESNSTCES